jgi:hypothetical protein
MSAKKTRGSPSGPRATQKFDGVVFDGGTITTATVAILTISVPGVKTTDVLTGANSIQKAGLIVTPRSIDVNDVVTIAIANPTVASITTGPVTYTFSVDHYSI